MRKLPVYLDHNATTPCDPRVVEAMMPYFSGQFGNAASRSHVYGWQAEEAVQIAREQVAALIGAEAGEIIFTSGATEADNLAIKGVLQAYFQKGQHIITVATEHKAVLDTCSHLEKKGATVTFLPVDKSGMLDVAEVEAAITPQTVLIAVMYANNETGVLHPVRQIGEVARKHNVLFFTDATQAVGKIPIDVDGDNIDILALSAHKFYGPKGVGALYVRRRGPRVRLSAQMDGGGHERGMRSGTLNVPGIVGLGMACEIAASQMEEDAKSLTNLRNKLEKDLLSMGNVSVNGNVNHRLPNVSNLSFAGVDSQALMGGLNRSIAVSSGSACMSASMEPSYVLKAMNVPDELAFGSIRFSLGRYTTDEDITFAAEEVKKVVIQLKSSSIAF